MDSKSKLLVRFYDDDDGTGKLLVDASSNGFAGSGSAWFGVDELVSFAENLSAYPLSDPSPIIRGGFYKKDMSGELDQEHLAIRVYPIDRTGHLGVQVSIATELWPHDRPESQHLVKLEIQTTYQPLSNFGKALKAVVAGRSKEAILGSDLEIAAG